MTSYLMAIITLHLPVNISEIFANQIICKKFDLENEGSCEREEKPDLYHSIGNVPFYIEDFFKEFELLGIMHL